MSVLYETHLHTAESSRCGRTPAREYVPYYLDQGYRGIVVTDHFTGNPSYVPDRRAPWRDQMDVYCRGYEEALNEGLKRGLDVFFGVEQAFASDECLIYGVDKQWLCDHPQIATWNRRELFDAVEAVGGCIVHAHPFRVRDYVQCITLNSCIHAVEAFNAGNNPQDDVYGLAFARQCGLPITAGSDMHRIGQRPDDMLYGVTFDQPWRSIMDYVDAIRSRRPFGVKTDPGRGLGQPAPLERPWDFRDENDRSALWSPDALFPETAR